MNDESEQATLACIEALIRKAAHNEASADLLGEQALQVGEGSGSSDPTRTIIEIARWLRVSAILCRGHAAGLWEVIGTGRARQPVKRG